MAKPRVLNSSRLSVCMSACNCAVPADGFSWRINIRKFLRKFVQKLQICLKSDKNIGHFTLRATNMYLFKYIIHIYLHIFCRQTTVKREPIFEFPRQHLTVLFCSQLHASDQQYKCNALLCFHGNTFKICLSSRCKNYSSKMARLIRTLSSANTRKRHSFV